METLADFLRARRGLVGPDAVGLVPGGRRHVRGLRREELALLAGISVDYYVRLEQGRDRNPSGEVLEALARALRLDDEAARHLHQLARPAGRKGRPRPSGRVRPAVTRLVEQSPWPALLVDRSLTVLCANRLAGVVHPGFTAGRNLVRDAFLDPATVDLHADPGAVRAECAAALRSAAGLHADDPGLQRLVGELSVHSEEFRRLWARAEVSYCRAGTKRFLHPLVGPLGLDYETLDVGDAGGQRLIVYSAAPGTPDGDKLALLGGMAAPATDDMPLRGSRASDPARAGRERGPDAGGHGA
mgnify:CR=1 FL=1